MAYYRNGIRVGLWLLAVFGGLAGICIVLWLLLATLGDVSGAAVARVLSLVWGAALGVDVLALVILLSRIQLNQWEQDRPRDGETKL